MPLPSITELGAMGGLDPLAYLQAQKQVDLGNQQGQQALEQGAANLQSTTLQNMFNQQNNPLLVQGQQLLNTGREYTNRESAVKAKQTEDLSAEDTAAKRSAMVKALDEDRLSSLLAKGKALMMDPDPDKAAAGKKMMDASFEETQRRAKDAHEIQKAQVGAEAKLAGYQMGLEGRKYAADRALEGRQYSADTMARVKAATANQTPKSLEQAYVKAIGDLQTNPTDPAAKEYADAMYETMMAARQAASGVKPDLNKLGVETIGTPPRPQITQSRSTGAPVQGAGAPTNTTEAGMARDLAPLIARVNSPAEAQKEIQDTTAMLPSMNPQDRQNAQQYISGLKSKFGGASPPAPSGLPPGAKQIGTSGGRPVFQTPDGKQFIGK